jgi:hypothetical protein
MCAVQPEGGGELNGGGTVTKWSPELVRRYPQVADGGGLLRATYPEH